MGTGKGVPEEVAFRAGLEALLSRGCGLEGLDRDKELRGSVLWEAM